MELDTLKVDQFKGLKNVVVTLSPNGNKDIKMVGLFGGIMPITKTDSVIVSKEDVYVCLIKGTTVHFLSSLFYYVAYIEIAGLNAGTSPVTLMTPYNETNSKDALAVMHKIHQAMREEKRVTEFDMIDDEKYSGLTEIQKREINSDGPVNTASKQPFNRSGAQNLGSEDGWNGWYGHAARGHNPNACGYSSTTTYTKKVTTATFSRTKKAEQAELDEMAAKIKAIQEGTYTPPALPTIPADNVKEKKEDEKKVITTTATSKESSSVPSSDDYDEGNIYMCG